MTLTTKQYREELEHILINVLELKIGYQIRNTLIHKYYDCIEDLVNNDDTDTPNLRYKKFTKA